MNWLTRCSAFALLLLTSCEHPSAEGMKSWLGAPANEIVAAWGPPSYVKGLPNGGGEFNWRGYTKNPTRFVCALSVLVDRTGTIYEVQWNNCPRNVVTPDQVGRTVGFTHYPKRTTWGPPYPPPGQTNY
jgi:hypothetical protein